MNYATSIISLFLFGVLVYYVYEKETSQQSLWDDYQSSDDSDEEYEKFKIQIYS